MSNPSTAVFHVLIVQVSDRPKWSAAETRGALEARDLESTAQPGHYYSQKYSIIISTFVSAVKHSYIFFCHLIPVLLAKPHANSFQE